MLDRFRFQWLKLQVVRGSAPGGSRQPSGVPEYVRARARCTSAGGGCSVGEAAPRHAAGHATVIVAAERDPGRECCKTTRSMLAQVIEESDPPDSLTCEPHRPRAAAPAPPSASARPLSPAPLASQQVRFAASTANVPRHHPPPSPSLPYGLDTSRPSSRTDRTRCLATHSPAGAPRLALGAPLTGSWRGNSWSPRTRRRKRTRRSRSTWSAGRRPQRSARRRPQR